MRCTRLACLIATLSLLSGCDRILGNSHLKLSGTLELTEHTLGARTAGRLATLLVDDGDDVRRGQLLGTLDRYDQAKRDYERLVHLFERGGASQQEVEHAQLAVEDQQVVSPVDGVVLVKVREQGEIVAAGSPIIVIGDRRQLWVRLYVPEGRINQVHLRQSASVRFDGVDRAFTGHVSFIAPSAEFTPRNVQTAEERITQTFAVKVTLDEPAPFLRPGVAADVAIDLKG